ncbi:MAG: diaminopimelate decarboxylase [Methanomassiliicoccaceae archaeon]|nr:diaminopimelate decarboxylase [Methanomassiliicoccaceae archaeon]
MENYESKGGRMLFAGMYVSDIAREFGTPVYVTDEQKLRKNYRNIHGAFSKEMDARIHYACKANSNLAILRILEQEGSGIDAVSAGEVLTCLKAGFTADRIMFTGVNVSNEELKTISDLGVMINIDSESELERLADIHPGAKISVRVNPNVGSGHSDKVITGKKGTKFGIPADRALNVYSRANDLGFDIRGIHAHIGSGGQDIAPFLDETEILANITNSLSEIGIELEFIDIGGGIGVPYRMNEEPMNLEELAAEVTDMIKMETDVKTIILEPGRYIVADTTLLLTKCVDIKDLGFKKYMGVDAGMNTLVRPAMYDSYHHVAVADKFGKACTAKYDVVGPICESGDYLAHERVLPDPQEGDILAVYDAGAYGFSMSSNYNSRPLCREVLVNDGKAELIREAETVDDLWRLQRIPARLKK